MLLNQMQSNHMVIDCTAFHPSYASGGVSLYQQEILTRMDRQFGFHAFYKEIAEGVLDQCGPCIVSKEVVRGNMLVWRDRAVRRFRQQGYRGVWYPTQFSSWLPVLPAVATIHDMAAFLSWRSFGWMGKWYMPASLLFTCRNARKLIVVSEATASDLHRLLPWAKHKTVIAPHGLPSDVRDTAETWKISERRQSGPFELIFLDGGNLRKRLDLCLRALEKIGWKEITLRITGNPDQVRKRIMVTLGRIPKEITLVGRLERQDLLLALAAADLLVYPSDFEGFGFPLVESMAFGTSVVSFPGNAEREVGGKSAIFTTAPTVDALIHAIREALERSRDTHWSECLMRHALSFKWDDSVTAHQAVFEELIG